MNANELADYVLNVIMCVEDFEGERFEKISTMLRQQQVEIEALKAKTLTDEEIAEVFDNTFKVRDFDDAFLKFARAILRKASEK